MPIPIHSVGNLTLSWDHRAFDALTERHYARLRRAAVGILRDIHVAEDGTIFAGGEGRQRDRGRDQEVVGLVKLPHAAAELRKVVCREHRRNHRGARAHVDRAEAFADILYLMAAFGRKTTHVTIDCWGSNLLAMANLDTGFGAGPVHACGVADLLESDRVIFPVNASVLSAFGTLVSPVRIDLARSLPRLFDEVEVVERDALLEVEPMNLRCDPLRLFHLLGESASLNRSVARRRPDLPRGTGELVSGDPNGSRQDLFGHAALAQVVHQPGGGQPAPIEATEVG